MVADPRAPACPGQLRPLNRPRPVGVVGRGPDGAPAWLVEGGRRRRVGAVEDTWWVEDEWWRRPVSRRYYRLALADGGARTVYHDLADDAWYAQPY